MSRDIRKEIISDRIKMVIKLERELSRIYAATHNLGYIELDKPIRDGWFRTFRLRDDIKRSKHGPVFQEILDKVTVRIWGRERKSANIAWIKYFKDTYISYQRPGIRYLTKEKFDKLSAKAKRHFRCVLRKGYRRYEEHYVCLVPRYYFIENYDRAFITRRKIIAPELERRAQEIEETLLRLEFYNISKYTRYRNRLYHCPNKVRRVRTRSFLSQIDLEDPDARSYISERMKHHYY